jgi:O-antigen/teichoic acid export membrane protein
MISLTKINDHSLISIWAFSLLAITAFIQPIINFFDALYRTSQDFKKLGKFIVIDNSIYAINISLLFFLGYFGYVIQAALKLIVSMSLRASNRIRFLKFSFSFNTFKDLISTGFPILINGYLYSTFFIFDQFYIVRTFERVELGYYNLARLVLIIIPIIPNSLTTIFYPKAAAAYGKSGNQKNILKSFFLKALFINIIVVIPMVALVYIFIQPMVVYFLPKYINGIDYAKISILGGIGYIFVGPSVILGVLKKNTFNFILLVIMTLLTYGLFFLGLIKFDSIESLIWYKNILFISYTLVMLFYAYKLISKSEWKENT